MVKLGENDRACMFHHVSLDKGYCHAFYFGIIKVPVNVSDII